MGIQVRLLKQAIFIRDGIHLGGVRGSSAFEGAMVGRPND